MKVETKLKPNRIKPKSHHISKTTEGNSNSLSQYSEEKYKNISYFILYRKQLLLISTQ